jgi:hypothetical protein
VALDRLSKSRGGTPTGERVPAGRAPRPLLYPPPQAGRMKVAGAEVGDTRLPAFRLPFFRGPDETNGSGPKWPADEGLREIRERLANLKAGPGFR